MTRKAIFALTLMMALSLLIASVGAKTDAPIDREDSNRIDAISGFDLGPYAPEVRGSSSEMDLPTVRTQGVGREQIGSAMSPNVGTGVGTSIDQTWDDVQIYWGAGRQVAHWYNGLTGVDAEVSVHFGYRDARDTLVGWPYTNTGYNVYDATVSPNGDWPRGQDAGCEMQGIDTIGYGFMTSLDMMDNGRVVIGATSALFFNDTLADGSPYYENQFYFQAGEWGCTYTPALNTSFIDSNTYQVHFMDATEGNHSRDAQIITQFDGTNTIVHCVLGESNATALTGIDYVEGDASEGGDTDYRVYTYYRKVGNTASAGSWSSGQILDSLWFVWTSLAAAPFPHTGVAFVYTNASAWGAQLNHSGDVDVWCRESPDRGISWPAAYSITNYTNAIPNDPAHFTAWLEASCFFSSDGDLHAIWTAKPTSAAPYQDGFNWNDFDENLYHWAKSTNEIAKIATGNFMNPDMLTGSMNTWHCGFGGTNVGYLGYAMLGECDNKLYAFWSQIHTRAVNSNWREDETLIDDCSLDGSRLGKANWEVMVSIAGLDETSCWDPPRSVSDTYTPRCGLPGDVGTDGLCGSEWKPSVEKYALNESGLDLYWPSDAVVDLTPAGDPAYNNGWYLNLQYMDDQYPGPGSWGDNYSNPPLTENSEKWVRLACVEPIQASLIAIGPVEIAWPLWVQTGAISNFEITVTNEGNVTLNVDEIGSAPITGSGWLSIDATPAPPAYTVDACIGNTNTFNIVVDATGLVGTQWLDGVVWVKSDAANSDSVGVRLHILAAAEVEPAVWDTAFTHAEMYTDYGVPEGDCIGLAVGNNGEMGYGLEGGVNLDFAASLIECGTRGRDAIYLATGTAYVLDADAAGENVLLSTSASQRTQAAEYGFDPIGTLGSITGGLGTGALGTTSYDSVSTGRFVNRDTTIAWERTVYAPRHDITNNSFMIVQNKVYSADGAGHNNIAIGNLSDWDVPADEPPDNISATSPSGSFTYVQGTDTLLSDACQSNTSRFGTEAFGGWYVNADSCTQAATYYGSWAGFQMLMEDTNQMRDGTPLDPRQPDPQAWWDDIGANPDNSGYVTVEDQAVWLTVLYDYDLAAADTVFFWTVYSTVRNGTLLGLELQVAVAKAWYEADVLGCGGAPPTCCIGTVGNVNGDINEEVTIGDIAVLVNHLFIEKPLLDCVLEADINQSGGPDPSQINPGSDITIGDVAIMTDYLFITTPAIYGPLLTCF